MTQSDPTDHALAAIASILDRPESHRDPEKPVVADHVSVGPPPIPVAPAFSVRHSASFCPPFVGSTDVGAFRAERYSSHAEINDPAKANPLKYATLGFKNVTAMAKAAGL